jgi:uncharacterized protein (DUF736 family)
VKRLLLGLVLAIPAIPADCDFELVARWNAFSRAANEYVHTRPAKPELRAKAKAKLNKLWIEVNECECF